MTFRTYLILFGVILCTALIIFFIPHTSNHARPKMNISEIQGYKRGSYSISPIPIKDFDVIHVFATWCDICIQDHMRILNIVRNTELQILGIVWHDTPINITSFLSKHNNPYSELIFIDDDQSIDLGITGVPETFIVGTTGKIIYNYKGAITEEMIYNALHPKS